MNRFVEQCVHTRRGRMRAMAEDALREYDLSGSRLTFIGQSFNTVYRVDTAAGEAYVLRMHRLNGFDLPEMRSEFQWLEYLKTCGDVLVSEPIRNRAGDFVTELTVKDVPGRHYCTLLRWHPGTALDDAAPHAQCDMVGSLLAKLHNCAVKFNPPEGFVRPWRGIGYAHQCVRQIQAAAPAGLFSRDVMRVLDATADHVASVMAEIGQDCAEFGLIHGDLHGGNVLFDGQTVRAIDFDGCGWGHYLYDVAISTYYLPPHCESLIVAGYRKHRDLFDHQVNALKTFRALRVLDQLAYQLPDPVTAAQTLTRLQPYELLGSKLPRGLPSRFEAVAQWN